MDFLSNYSLFQESKPKRKFKQDKIPLSIESVSINILDSLNRKNNKNENDAANKILSKISINNIFDETILMDQTFESKNKPNKRSVSNDITKGIFPMKKKSKYKQFEIKTKGNEKESDWGIIKKKEMKNFIFSVNKNMKKKRQFFEKHILLPKNGMFFEEMSIVNSINSTLNNDNINNLKFPLKSFDKLNNMKALDERSMNEYRGSKNIDKSNAVSKNEVDFYLINKERIPNKFSLPRLSSSQRRRKDTSKASLYYSSSRPKYRDEVGNSGRRIIL